MANEKTGLHLGSAKAKNPRSMTRRSGHAASKRRPMLELKGTGPMISVRRLPRSAIAFTNALTESFYRAKVAALREQGVTVDHA